MKAAASKSETLFIYAGNYYHYKGDLSSIILNGMKKHHIKSSIVITLTMWRNKLVSQKQVKREYKKNERLSENDYKNESVQNDLDEFYENILSGSLQQEEYVCTNCFKQLTEKEEMLVEMKKNDYFDSLLGNSLKTTKNESSESDSKFLQICCSRRSVKLSVKYYFMNLCLVKLKAFIYLLYDLVCIPFFTLSFNSNLYNTIILSACSMIIYYLIHLLFDSKCAVTFLESMEHMIKREQCISFSQKK